MQDGADPDRLGPAGVRRRRPLVVALVAVLAVVAVVAVVAGLMAVGGLTSRQPQAVPATSTSVTHVPTSFPTGPGLPRRIPSSKATVVVLGDSVSTGFTTSAEASWPNVMVQDFARQGLGVTVINGARVGAGYVQPGEDHLTFGDQARLSVVPGADLVLVFGSENDRGHDPAQVTARAGETIAAIRERAPDARILLVGPIAATTVPDQQLTAIRDAVSAAARTAGVPFVDPLAQHWFTVQSETLIGPDGTHPTVLGQKRLAVRMAGLVRPLIPH